MRLPRRSQQERLERKIDQYEQERFLTPVCATGGSAALPPRYGAYSSAGYERRLITWSREEEVNPNLIIYFNRLSDLSYVMARVDEQREIEQAVLNQFKSLGLEVSFPCWPKPRKNYVAHLK
ncbi:MAG: hypothetical protein U0401_16125 [Anaerolineae bacterium]